MTMAATGATATFQARFDAATGRLRSLAARAGPALRAELLEVADELHRLRRDLAGIEPLPPPASLTLIDGRKAVTGADLHARRSATARERNDTGPATDARVAAKNRGDKRFCQRHDDGEGAWLPRSAFDVKDRTKGTLKTWCRACTLAYQRARYVHVGEKVVVVELADGDALIGRPCPVCEEPFCVGERIQGEQLRHAGCRRKKSLASPGPRR